MHRSKIYNATLLHCIAEEGTITIEALKKKYLPPEQPGIVQGVTVMFDSDLITLQEEGFVIIQNDVVQYIQR